MGVVRRRGGAAVRRCGGAAVRFYGRSRQPTGRQRRVLQTCSTQAEGYGRTAGYVDERVLTEIDLNRM